MAKCERRKSEFRVVDLKINECAGRALLPDEETGLLRAVSQVGTGQEHWSPIYTVTVLGLNTGLRHSEVRQLRWANLGSRTD